MPGPVGTALTEKVVTRSTSVAETAPAYTPVLLPAAGRARVPTPGATDCRAAPTEAVHAPPASASPPAAGHGTAEAVLDQGASVRSAR
ncbi:hypothetical protein A7K94_0202195 [Modestobacter sp. VKM Ac-2676]|nr:hypothetical protein A7K94_0202195 [Modestobacter sp. VKM Ac-2676]